MRVLFSSTLGYGHVFPMVPLAQACLAAGHDVLWVAGEPAGPLVEAAGIPYAAAGLDAHWVRTAPPARPSPQRLCACSTSSRFACRQKRFRRRSPRCPRLPTSRRRCPGLRARPAEIHLPRLRALGRAPAAAPARYRGRDIDVPREAATAGTVQVPIPTHSTAFGFSWEWTRHGSLLAQANVLMCRRQRRYIARTVSPSMPVKSSGLRVTTGRPCATAVAAMSAS